MNQLSELEETFVEEYESALLLQKANKKKAVTILLSKSIFALVDFILFKRYQLLPKNHAERFRKLEEREPEIYRILDNVWSKYTDTYSKPAVEESIMMLDRAIKEIIKKNEDFSEKIKTCVE